MEDIQQSKLIFYLPILAGYAIACASAYLLFKMFGMTKVNEQEARPRKPYLELILGLGAAAAILAIGRIYTAGFLLPATYNPLSWIINNLIIYSPIFIVLIARKQSTATIWITPGKWYLKVITGITASVLGVALFLGLRSEWYRWLPVIVKSFSLNGLSYFVAIFLEGVALAFLFIRIKWVANLKIALAIPALLFALAHVPGMIAENDPWWHIILMSLVTGSITVFVLYTCNKTRDIIWIGFVHYFLDAAINAF